MLGYFCLVSSYCVILFLHNIINEFMTFFGNFCNFLLASEKFESGNFSEERTVGDTILDSSFSCKITSYIIS